MKRALEEFPLSFKSCRILGLGAEGKNRLCLAKGQVAYLSEEIGDLKFPRNFLEFQKRLLKFPKEMKIQPEVVTHDLHPLYLSTRRAQKFKKVRCLPVQHHWAHIGSVLVERNISSPVIGLAFDGTGFGLDGNLWGGEILLANLKNMERMGHFRNIFLPGGEAAIKEPYRLAFSFLYEMEGEAFLKRKHPLVRKYGKEAPLILEILKKRFNSPLSSSVGRLFDAISALLGIKDKVLYEGEAAQALELEAEKGWDDLKGKNFSYQIEKKKDIFILNPIPMFEDILEAQKKKIPKRLIAAMFHLTLVEMATDICKRVREMRKINQVVLSGGVFQNKILKRELKRRLELARFEVFLPERVPIHDGGLALGQVGIAAYAAR